MLDCIIIGGGPAGLMAANTLENKLNYVLLEKNDSVAKKLRLTGGKRSNVTNVLSVPEFIEALTMPHKRFLYKALSQFGPKDIIEFFKGKGVTLELEDDFKYFPSDSKSTTIRDALLRDIDRNHILYQQSVKHIAFKDAYYELTTHNGEMFHSKAVIVAVGSNSYPTTGSSGDVIRFASSLNIETLPFKPSETVIYTKEPAILASTLQGYSRNVKITINQEKKAYEGDLLITHFGLSGPVILYMSEFVHDELENGIVNLYINFLENAASIILDHRLTKLTLKQVFEPLLEKKLLKTLLTDHLLDSKVADLTKKEMTEVSDTLSHYKVEILRVESIQKSFVNRGGISTKALNPMSMESLQYKNLFFVGECTDLQGPIGGFNITIALSTARLAATHLITTLKDS